MRCVGWRLCHAEATTAALAASAAVADCMEAIHRGRANDALPQLNKLKAASVPIPSVDYARALCFLEPGPQNSPMAARQSLLEELRLHPDHHQAQQLLYQVNEALRPLLLPPAEIQKQHPLFALLCDALLDSTMLTWPRLLHLYQATERLSLSQDGGHVVECGTAGGGSAVLMAVVLAEQEAAMGRQPPSHMRRVFALDTFTGMPRPGCEDRLVASAEVEAAASPVNDDTNAAASWGTGTCRSSVEHVRQLARAFAVDDRLVVLPGLFASSIPAQLLPRADIQREGLALLHVDADWYDSTRTALQLLVPLMRRGGNSGSTSGSGASSAPPPPRMVQVDDYHYWEGCRRAVDECLASWPPSTVPLVEDVDGNAICFAVDRGANFDNLC